MCIDHEPTVRYHRCEIIYRLDIHLFSWLQEQIFYSTLIPLRKR